MSTHIPAPSYLYIYICICIYICIYGKNCIVMMNCSDSLKNHAAGDAHTYTSPLRIYTYVCIYMNIYLCTQVYANV